ncbi:MAG: FIST N-terminal domain-containing protein [Planctomycetota bacterium]
MPTRSTPSAVRLAAGVSANLDATLAAESVAEQVGGALGDHPDLAVLFVSGEHVGELTAIIEHIRAAVRPSLLIGASAYGVVGGTEEIEEKPAVSLLAGELPGVTVRTFRDSDLPRLDAEDEDAPAAVARALKLDDPPRGMVLLGDPFSFPASPALSVLSTVGNAFEDSPRVPIIGGMASSARQAGQNVLILDDQLLNAGAVGVCLSGAIEVGAVVSQGCRPIGSTLVVTDCERNIVKSLSGRPATTALRETIDSLDHTERAQLEMGLFVGIVVDEYKDRFGRGDFLVRAVLGIDREQGHLAFGDLVRRGQTVQFHVRDAQTASEDLGLLLDGQRVRRPAAGALLVTCNGRGRRLFGRPHHDAQAVQRALGEALPGPEDPAATPEVPTVPVAGFFAQGEFGPIGGQSHVHGHTASLAVFRSV